MTAADDVNTVDPEAVSLTEAMLGYDILVDGEYAGAIEGVSGELEYLTVELHWEDKGVGRAALNEFIELSLIEGCSEVSTNNATHPAMEHILETEGFEKRSGEIGWMKEL